MKNLALVLTLFSVPAWAEWTLVARSDAVHASTYADITTIHKQTGSIVMWTLVDFQNAQRAPYGPAYLSQKARQEFDCDGLRSRVVEVVMHAGHMGGEDVVSASADPDEWEPVRPESISEALWKIACGKP
jgi:hypothetical protein